MKIDSDTILFFERIVEPAIREFDAADDALDDAADLDDARSLVMRRARTAAIELHQFCDRVFDSAPEWRSRGGLEGIRDWLTAEHVRREYGDPVDDLAVLHDVADAFKHAKLTRGRDRAIRTDRAVVCLSTGYGQLGFNVGKSSGGEQVIVELLNGQKRSLSMLLWTVRDAWASAMGLPRWLR